MSLIVGVKTRLTGEGTMEHEELRGRRGIGPDGQAWHLDTDAYNRLMNMQFYRGAFADEAGLILAHPTDIIGSYAIVLDTQTFWIWSESGKWVNTGATVTEITGLPPGGTTGQVLGKASDIDGDVDWINQTGGSGGGTISGRHNDLMGLQGGAATERFHVNNSQHNTLVAIVEGRPIQPINLYPLHGATGILEMAIFESSPYINPFGVPMYGYQIEISTLSGTIIYDSGNVELTVTTFRIPEGKLVISTSYKWRVRYQAGNLAWSDWSDFTEFSTASDFSSFVATPSLLRPSMGDVINSPYPTLITTPFEASTGLIQSDGDFQISATSDFSSIIDSGTGKNLFVGTQALTRGLPYFARARHKATTGEVSAYSFPHMFTARSLYREQRIGIVLADEDNFIFRRIDGDYNPVDIDGDYWMSNAIWSAWSSSVSSPITINGNVMFSMPSVWINSGFIPSGPFIGKRFWMIDSTTPTEKEQENGWHLHGSFAHPDGGYQDNLLVSMYLINSNGKSISGAPVEGDIGTHKTNAAKNNTNISNIATRGYQVMPYYVHQLFILLATIELGSPGAIWTTFSPYRTTYNNTSGWRGYKGNNANGVLLNGLTNKTISLPGPINTVILPRSIYPSDAPWTSSATYGGFEVTSFMSSNDGVPDILNINDYFIPQTRVPSVMYTGDLTSSYQSRSIITGGYATGTGDYVQMMCGTYDFIGTGVYGLGTTIKSQVSRSTGYALMVKYD